MATQGADEKDLQALASLLADIESQLTPEYDQSELLRLRDWHQQCLLELALVRAGKQRKED